MKKLGILMLGCLFFIMACQKEESPPPLISEVQEGAQAISLRGDLLFRSTPSDGQLKQLEEARENYLSDPDKVENIIWFGRRMAYTGDYREAIRIFSDGLQKFPEEARLYRHRGHRYISIREFDRAIQDFEKAVSLIEGKEDSIEPDGQPNEQNIPVSTLFTNIWYHLGLAYYLKDDLDNALRVYLRGIQASTNDDMLIAMLHWYYMSFRLMGREDEAQTSLDPVQKEMNIIENTAYHQLCLLYKGEITIEEMTSDESSETANDAVAYGIGNWYFYNGHKDKAQEVFEKIIEKKVWASFGHIAAEAHLVREY
ncbi:tetratricopeptide repeat protein [Acidobacteriota bacterium]